MNIDVLSQLQSVAGAGGFAVSDNLGLLVSRIVGLFLIAGTLAAFIYFVWGGFQWITSGSDKGKTEEARTKITNAIIGLALVASSWAIFGVINYFFGLNLTGEGASTSTNSNSSSYIAPASSSCSRGICVVASRCVSGPPPANAYCQNSLYRPLNVGPCTLSGGQAGVCCDCVNR